MGGGTESHRIQSIRQQQQTLVASPELIGRSHKECIQLVSPGHKDTAVISLRFRIVNRNRIYGEFRDELATFTFFLLPRLNKKNKNVFKMSSSANLIR